MNDNGDRLGIGGNQPPGPTPIERAQALAANCNRWIAERPKIEDREIAGLAQGFVTQLRLNKTELEAAEKAERKPFDMAVAAVRVKYRVPLELVGIALVKMLAKLEPFLQAERERLRIEDAERKRQADEAKRAADRARQEAESGTVEAEQQAREAERTAKELAKAAAKAPERARVKGDMSLRAMTLRAYWHAEVTDPDEALEFYGHDASVRLAALEAATKLASALAAEVKDATRAPPGFKFVRTERAV